MTRLLGSLRGAVLLGVGLIALVHLLLAGTGLYGWGFSADWLRTVMRLLHVMSAVLWLGLLYYFNLVQIPSMARLGAELKPAVTGMIAPLALLWFRWGAVATVATGLLLAIFNGYLRQALTLGVLESGSTYTAIGIGMWLGIFMALNVWLVVWPAQRKALGLVCVSDEDKAAAAARALRAARLNTALSFPMLYCMVAAQNFY